MNGTKRVILIVLDSAGVGALPDAADYGDAGANTLGHIGDGVGLSMPHCGALGLGNIIPINGTPPTDRPAGLYGKAAEKSKGKDTTTGHWEIAGLVLDKPFPLYPDGFSPEIIDRFCEMTGRGVLGNRTASGTAIIQELGDEHCKSGDLIVYTSADSVFQVAAHEDVVPVETLYEYCTMARSFLKVGRVIARPFVGTSGNYSRTKNRHDFSIKPAGDTMLDRLSRQGFETLAVGKIYDIFAGQGLTDFVRTTSNMDGVDRTLDYMKSCSKGLIFTNLVDFDMEFGHRRNVKGYKNALEAFDRRMPEITGAMRDDDLLILTADHGCDPTYSGTDHTREYVPVLAYAKGCISRDIGIRESYADIAATVESVLTGVSMPDSFV